MLKVSDLNEWVKLANIALYPYPLLLMGLYIYSCINEALMCKTLS